MAHKKTARFRGGVSPIGIYEVTEDIKSAGSVILIFHTINFFSFIDLGIRKFFY